MVAALALAGCGGKDRPTPAAPISNTVPAPEPTPPPPDEEREDPPLEPVAATQLDPAVVAAFEQQVLSTATGVPECDAYLRGVLALVKCDKLPGSAQEAMLEGGNAMLDAFGTARFQDPQLAQQVSEGCGGALDALRQAAPALGCTPP